MNVIGWFELFGPIEFSTGFMHQMSSYSANSFLILLLKYLTMNEQNASQTVCKCDFNFTLPTLNSH